MLLFTSGPPHRLLSLPATLWPLWTKIQLSDSFHARKLSLISSIWVTCPSSVLPESNVTTNAQKSWVASPESRDRVRIWTQAVESPFLTTVLYSLPHKAVGRTTWDGACQMLNTALTFGKYSVKVSSNYRHNLCPWEAYGQMRELKV